MFAEVCPGFFPTPFELQRHDPSNPIFSHNQGISLSFLFQGENGKYPCNFVGDFYLQARNLLEELLEGLSVLESAYQDQCLLTTGTFINHL
jgi:hypothetical protein